jgi:hypothetical protein
VIAIPSSWASEAAGVLFVEADVAGNALSGSGTGTADWRGFAIFPLAGDATSAAMPGTLITYLTGIPGPREPGPGAEPEQEPEQELGQVLEQETRHANKAIREWHELAMPLRVACGLVILFGWL